MPVVNQPRVASPKPSALSRTDRLHPLWPQRRCQFADWNSYALASGAETSIGSLLDKKDAITRLAESGTRFRFCTCGGQKSTLKSGGERRSVNARVSLYTS